MSNTKPNPYLNSTNEVGAVQRKSEEVKRVTFSKLFRYVNGFHKFLFIVGIIAASLAGLANSCKFIIFREFMDKLDTDKSNQEKAGNYLLL